MQCLLLKSTTPPNYFPCETSENGTWRSLEIDYLIIASNVQTYIHWARFWEMKNEKKNADSTIVVFVVNTQHRDFSYFNLTVKSTIRIYMSKRCILHVRLYWLKAIYLTWNFFAQEIKKNDFHLLIRCWVLMIRHHAATCLFLSILYFESYLQQPC